MVRRKNAQQRYEAISETLSESLPNLSGWLAAEDEVRELRFKVKEDGTMLVVAKGYFADGSLSVAFGTGYGLSGALLGIDATLQGGRWKIDKPWAPVPVRVEVDG